MFLGAVPAGFANEQAEAAAKAEYEAAEKAAREAEAQVGPLREALQKSDKAYADARNNAVAKRQKATDAKNLSGEPGVKELQAAEAAIPAAIKALTDAANAKPGLDKALAEAKAAAAPLQQAYDAAEKAAKDAEAAARAAADAANKIENEAKIAEAQAVAKRRVVDSSKATLARAQQNEQKLMGQVKAAMEGLPEVEKEKKAADDALAAAKGKFDAVNAVFQAAEKAAAAAEADAKAVSAADKQKADADAVAKRAAAGAAQAALAKAQEEEKQAQARVARIAAAPARKKTADEALASAKAQVAAAAGAHQKAGQAVQASEAVVKAVSADAAKSPEEKKKAGDDATAKRAAAEAAKTALAQAQQKEAQAQAEAGAAAKDLAEAPAQKKPADDALAAVKAKVAAADAARRTAEQAAQQAEGIARWIAGRFARTAEQNAQALAGAAEKRKAAEAAKVPVPQAQAVLEEARKVAETAAQKFAKLDAPRKAAEAGLTSIRNQIASGTQALAAAEQAVLEPEKTAAQKREIANQTAAKRKAAADAAAALAQAQKAEQDAQAQIAAAAKKAAEAQGAKNPADAALANARKQVAAANAGYATAEKAATDAAAAAKQVAADAAKPEAEKKKAADDAATKRKAADAAKAALAKAQQAEQAAQAPAADAVKKLAEAEAQKKAAEAALAAAKPKVAAATPAYQATQEAAKAILALDNASREAASAAAAKRKAANDAKAALAPIAKTLEQALLASKRNADETTRSEARKKESEQGLEDLKKRIASAKETNVADEKAAQEAEAAAVPLEVAAKKARETYQAAVDLAEQRRGLAQRSKEKLYRMVASRQVREIVESPQPPQPVNRIDEIVFAKLKAMGIQPGLSSDAAFIRRVFLDMTGKLPTAEEVKAFIQDPDKNKRTAVVDRLLDRTDHHDYWALKWGDVLRIKAEFPVKVWPNAAQAYHRWVWEAVTLNKPYDQFARELLTSNGSNYRVGPVNFYRAIQDRTPEGIAVSVGLALMGTRVFSWPEERRAGMAAFFSQVGFKPTSEWKEEIVFWDPLKVSKTPENTAEGIDAVVKAVAATNRIAQGLAQPLVEDGPLEAVFPDGGKVAVPRGRDPREVFADWLIRPENPWFAKAIVNRTWFWAMGRGIVEEPDDIRNDNPPSNPELLDFLAKELVSSGYDLRHLKRLIFTSATYQFSSIPRSEKPEAAANFSSYLLRRVEAEVLIDALNEITGSSDLYTSAVPEPFTYIPSSMTAVELADGSITSSFLTLFGRSARATGMESEKVSELASPQWLYMLNSGEIQNKLQTGPKLAAMLPADGKPAEVAERLYLTILSRLPTALDVQAVEEYSKLGITKGRDVWLDLAWALVNSPEFLLRH